MDEKKVTEKVLIDVSLVVHVGDGSDRICVTEINFDARAAGVRKKSVAKNDARKLKLE